MCCAVGLFAIGTIGFGWLEVRGRSRVPCPPAMTTAFTGFLPSPISPTALSYPRARPAKLAHGQAGVGRARQQREHDPRPEDDTGSRPPEDSQRERDQQDGGADLPQKDHRHSEASAREHVEPGEYVCVADEDHHDGRSRQRMLRQEDDQRTRYQQTVGKRIRQAYRTPRRCRYGARSDRRASQ